MLILDESTTGKGWRVLQAGETVKTLSQFFSHTTLTWKGSGFMTSDNFVNKGQVNYRHPVSLGAKISAIWAVKGKLWRRGVLRKKE